MIKQDATSSDGSLVQPLFATKCADHDLSVASTSTSKANTRPAFAGRVSLLLVCLETARAVYFLWCVTAFRSAPFVSLNARTAINVSAAAMAMYTPTYMMP